MSSSSSRNTPFPIGTSIPLLVILIGAGLAGNYFHYPIFLNIDFLFGSIFALLVLQFFGWTRGVIAAALIAGVTWAIWNHPYAIAVMTLEALVVGWLFTRRGMGLVLADAIYWLVIGMPLVYLFYHGVMEVPLTNTTVVMTKQAVNGIANALAARLLFTAWVLYRRAVLVSFRDNAFNLMAAFVLFPTLVLLAVSSQAEFDETDSHIRMTLLKDSKDMTSALEDWLGDRRNVVTYLAEMAVADSPKEMQHHLEEIKAVDRSFLRLGLHDRNAVTSAYAPQFDEAGQSNLGKNFSDRPFIPQLKQTLKPMLSEAVMGKVAPRKPVVIMLAPVIRNGEYDGYVAGVLNFQRILERRIDKGQGYRFTLLDKNGKIILTNHANQQMLTPLSRGDGALVNLDGPVSQWIPKLPPSTPISERWKKSSYLVESTIGELAEWKLIVEQPVAPFQKMLYERFINELILLLAILIVALAVAELLSRRMVFTIESLRRITHDLPGKLESREVIAWPPSAISETSQLIANFREMADSLTTRFGQVKQLNENLEQRIAERTRELAEMNRDFVSFLENTTDFIYFKDENSRFRFCSQTLANITGHASWRDMIGKHDLEVFPEETAKIYYEEEIPVFRDGIPMLNKIDPYLDAQGNRGWVRTNKWPLKDGDGKVVGIFGISEDVTESQQAQQALERSEQHFRAFFERSMVGMAVTSLNKEWVEVNDRLCEILGYSREELLRMTWEEITVPEDLPIQSKLCEEVMAGVTNQYELDKRFIHRNGHFVHTHVASRLLRKKDGSPDYFVVLIEDITRRREAELALREVNETLESLVASEVAKNMAQERMLIQQSRLAAMGEMIGNIAHQWRQPINALTLLLANIKDAYEYDELDQDYLDSEVIKGQQMIQRMSSTIDDFRNFFKPNKEKEEFIAEEPVEEAVKLVSHSFKNNNIELTLEKTCEPCRVSGYPNEFAQVVLNALSNAKDALLDQQRRDGKVSIRLEKSGSRLCVAIRDNAGGIPPDVLPKVFDPYFTTKEKGTGIGLYMSKMIMDNMDGEITIHNVEDGAEVLLSLLVAE